jgi:hypothetical protein
MTPSKKAWMRIAALPTDHRTEPRLPILIPTHDETTELDILVALSSMSPERLLEFERAGTGSDRCGDTILFLPSAFCVNAYIAGIAIRITSDTRDEEKDRNKDQRSKVCCKTSKIQEITIRYIILVIRSYT